MIVRQQDEEGTRARIQAVALELFAVHGYDGTSLREIAEVLGITANAASIRLHRARGKFKEELRKIDDAAGHEGVREGREP